MDRESTSQALRYLLVGGWNTAFGYGVFALLTYLLTGRIPYAYMAAGVLGHLIAVTAAFASYKRFVFRTDGGLLRQYLRCHVVYGSSFLVNLALLPVLVAGLHWSFGERPWVPYLAGGVLTAGTAIISFFAHKHFSFAVTGHSQEV